MGLILAVESACGRRQHAAGDGRAVFYKIQMARSSIAGSFTKRMRVRPCSAIRDHPTDNKLLTHQWLLRTSSAVVAWGPIYRPDLVRCAYNYCRC